MEVIKLTSALCVSSAHPEASRLGMQILKDGGNAVDAAIAMSYMLGVVEPYASGVGGGGVMLIAPPNDPVTVCDYRESSPRIISNMNLETGIPGFIKGMEKVHSIFGTLDYLSLIQPSIKMATDGYLMNKTFKSVINRNKDLLRKNAGSFLKCISSRNGSFFIRQPLLAETLKEISNGSDYFYKKNKSELTFINPLDFLNYKAIMRKPLFIQNNNYEFYSAPLPFGGVTLFQAISLYEYLGLYNYEMDSANYLHLWGQLFSQVYQDRDVYLGDTESSRKNIKNLLSEEYTKKIIQEIGFKTYNESLDEQTNTTHFVVRDKEGMCVSATNTIGRFFGTGKMIGGFFLNSQLSNFSSNKSSENYIAPNKRPMSYIAPTILKTKKQKIVIGAAGGKRIPFVLSKILMETLYNGKNLEESIVKPRYFIDDKTIYHEKAMLTKNKKELIQLGYSINSEMESSFFGGVQGFSLNLKSKEITGVADPRRNGKSIVF